MDDHWSELTDIEVQVTASDRLDLHYEHRDALEVQRGSWMLRDYLGGYVDLEAEVSGRTLRGQLLAVGDDWFQIPSALVRAQACAAIRTGSRADQRVPASPLTFRQALRHLAGRIPREVLLADGGSRIVQLEWIAQDFAHVRCEGRPELLPLRQVAAVLGRVEIPVG